MPTGTPDDHLMITFLASAPPSPPWSWNLVANLSDMLSYPFMVNAFRAGAIAAVVAGIAGWFMVLRRQTFAGHTLAVSAFPGATAATLLGISATAGYLAFAVAAAIVIAVASPTRTGRFSEESAIVGTLQAFVLACGYLFAYLYKGFRNSVDAPLFGSTFAVTSAQVVTLGVVAAVVLAVLAVIGRPLLFGSIDPDVAAARGVGVRANSTVFLVVLGAAAAEASQIVGALLVFALLVMPAATAQRLTTRPGRSVALTVAIALVATWGGIVLAYYRLYPIGFCVSSISFALFLAVRGAPLLAAQHRRAQHRRAQRPAEIAEAAG
jgi:zinc/manganese transport system permease protein